LWPGAPAMRPGGVPPVILLVDDATGALQEPPPGAATAAAELPIARHVAATGVPEGAGRASARQAVPYP